MKRSKQSRIRDQRVDIKVGPEVDGDLRKIKTMLEEVKARPFSMSEVIMLLCQWSEPSIAALRESKAKISELTTRKMPLGKTYE